MWPANCSSWPCSFCRVFNRVLRGGSREYRFGSSQLMFSGGNVNAKGLGVWDDPSQVWYWECPIPKSPAIVNYVAQIIRKKCIDLTWLTLRALPPDLKSPSIVSRMRKMRQWKEKNVTILPGWHVGPFCSKSSEFSQPAKLKLYIVMILTWAPTSG